MNVEKGKLAKKNDIPKKKKEVFKLRNVTNNSMIYPTTDDAVLRLYGASNSSAPRQ